MTVAMLLGMGVMLSLWREVEFARILGVSEQLDIFRIAFSLPNFVSQTFGTAFIAAMMPFLIAFERDDQDKIDAAFKPVLLVNMAMVAGITLIGLLTISWQAKILAPGFSGEMLDQTASSLVLCWLMFPFIGATFALRTRLNLSGVYWPGAVTMTVRAATFIVMLMLVNRVFPAVTLDSKMLSITAICGGAAVLIIHIFGTPKALLRKIVHGLKSGVSVDIQMRAMTLALGAALTYQMLHGIPRFIDRGYASGLGTGTVSAAEYSYSIVLVVGLLMGTAFNTVYLPRLSRNFIGVSKAPLADVFVKPLAVVLVISFVIGIVGGIWAPEIVSLVFERGAFSAEAGVTTSAILKWQLYAAAPTVAGIILGQSLIVIHIRSVLILAMAAKILTKFITMELLVGRLGAEGIGLSYFITEIIIALVLIVIFWRALARERTEQP